MFAASNFGRCRSIVAAAALWTSLAGCAGTVVVDYSVRAQVSGRDSNGTDWIAEPQAVVVVPRPAGLNGPFPAQQYRGSGFDWTFGTGTEGFGGDVVNNGNAPLCFRFDEATLSSNLHPSPVKLRVSVLAHTVDGPGKWTVLGTTDPRKRQYFDPPALCFRPGKTAHFTLGPDLATLFPNATMFNAKWLEGVPELTEKGTGNYLQIQLPLEQDGKSQTLRVKLTAEDSRARISTY